MRPHTLWLLAASLALTGPALATGTAGSDDLLRVGRTNIFCVQAPCPWRGVSVADPAPVTPANLLWVEQTLPPLEASEADARQIEHAWDNDQCLLIEGRFIGATLEVSRIVGDCS